MTTPNPAPTWNTQAKISCEFSFKCPKQWDWLDPTAIEGIRHCSECDRDVHLALTQEDVRRHAEDGHCVAVRVFRNGEDKSVTFMGQIAPPFETHLKKT
jgi:hypothetical protein